MYSKRTWLNDPRSSYTASVVAFDGKYKFRKSGKAERYMHLEISDCQQKIRIHPGHMKRDNKKAYIKKLKLLASEINEFANHLENS